MMMEYRRISEMDSTLEVDLSMNRFTNKIQVFRHFSIDFVEHTFSNFDSVDDLTFTESFDI